MTQQVRWAAVGLVCLLMTLADAGAETLTVTQPQGLGELLGARLPAYSAGLGWDAQSAVQDQRDARTQLQQDLQLLGQQRPWFASRYAALQQTLQRLPVSGRVPLPASDPRLLLANPQLDPQLQRGDRVRLPARPTMVAVLREDGQICRLGFVPGAPARAYVQACNAGATPRTVWIAQPDGHVQEFGNANWNATEQDPPAPGAWIWAPSDAWTPLVSREIAAVLATLPLAGADFDALDLHLPVSPLQALTPQQAAMPMPHGLWLSRNDFGEPGVLQTPSARLGEAGDVSFTLSRVYPYSRINFFLQPLDWLEFGFRYTSVSDALYGPSIAGNQAYKDKSLDVRMRLWNEGRIMPAFALGIQDVGGTGLFSSEYMVASKRLGDFDWNAGLAWGYLGGRQSLSNPFDLLSAGFATRSQTTTGQGGVPSLKSYFHGRTAPFVGVTYQTPWPKLALKAEFDPNNYQHEPLGSQLPVRAPINVGAVYRLNDNIELGLGVERGNTVQLQLSMHGNVARSGQPKTDLLPLPPLPRPLLQQVRAQDRQNWPVPAAAPVPPPAPDWPLVVAADIRAQTNASVALLRDDGDTLELTLDHVHAFYLPPQVERIVRLLVQDAPARFITYRIGFSNEGLRGGDFVVDRQQWLRSHAQWLPPGQRQAAVVVARADADPQGRVLLRQPSTPWHVALEPALAETVGGPNAFLLYQISANASASYHFSRQTWVSGDLNLGLLDNYNKFTYDAPSSLPRVRTNIREYVTSSRLTLPRLQWTHVGMLAPQTYYSVYAGALESMYAGVGGEVLYRPWGQPFAYGVDVNDVRQRGFRQDFSLLGYHVLTGHATVYWKTGYDGVLAKLSAGQYLAGDKGVTLDVSRTFGNGVQIGVYATKTNISAATFGEGSFDKGIYLNIPFDAMLTRSSAGSVHLLWQPLLRDGGAQLNRAYPLYDLTRNADPDGLAFGPPQPQLR